MQRAELRDLFFCDLSSPGHIMNVTQLVAYDLAAFMLKPVVDPTQMRSFEDETESDCGNERSLLM